MARWWEHPQLWPDEETIGERKVGFLDLFYDLIFVVAIAQIAHGLAKHPGLDGTIDFVLLILPLFWLWIGHTFYVDRFENRDISHILFTFASMLPVVGMAVFAHHGRDETAAGFALSYAIGRLLLVFMYARAARHVPQMRKGAYSIAGGFGLGALFWVASAFIADQQTRTIVQLTGLAWDFFVPILVAPIMRKLPNFAEGRLRERFGLIMIIVLGESVAGTVNGLADVHHFGWTHAITAGFAMFVAFSIYFTYFEMVPREQLSKWQWAAMTRTYLHLALVCAVTATGAGVLATVGHLEEVQSPQVRSLVAGSLGVSYLVLVGMSRVHEYKYQGAGRKGTEIGLWIAIVISGAVAILGANWTGLQLLGVMAFASAIPWIVGVGAWAKFTRHLPKQAEEPTQG